MANSHEGKKFLATIPPITAVIVIASEICLLDGRAERFKNNTEKTSCSADRGGLFVSGGGRRLNLAALQTDAAE